MIQLYLALFTSAVPYPPLLARLKASGGDRARIIHARSAQDFLRLERGKRYKFAVDEPGRLLIAPLPADAPNNEYVHPILAGGGPVRTAGGIVIDHQNGKILKVTVDQDSKSYCPTMPSLEEVVRALERLGVAPSAVARQDRPPRCEEKADSAR